MDALRLLSTIALNTMTLFRLVTLAVLLSAAACAQTLPEISDADAVIQDAVDSGRIPGAVLVVGHAGKIVYHKAYGFRAIEPIREPMTVDTIFDCASLTKVVATTSSVMKLFEEGKVRMSDKVTDYLPEFEGGKSDITVANLMTHFSGLRPDLDLEPPWSGYETGLALAFKDVPAGPPAKKFVYSDINFLLMGEIVHRVSKESLPAYARRVVFDPLGMRDTMFLPPASLLPRIAPTEKLKTGQILRGVVDDTTARYMGGVAGDAGLFSTGDDLARFCQMLLDRGEYQGRRLFSPLTVDKFTSPESPAGQPILRGYGWDIDSPLSGNRGELFPAGTSYGHTGYTGTSLWIDPASQTYVVLLTNAVHPTVRKPITPIRKSVATVVAAAVGYETTGRQPAVWTGLDALEDQGFRPLLGKRVGLITNHTGVDRQGRRNIDQMLAAGVKIAALYSPEHGIAGKVDQPVGNTTDAATRLPVITLFSGNNRPAPHQFRGMDVVVFDIADIGARFYTYTTTMAYAMEECARDKVKFMVLDRPNPITGLHVEGPVLDLSLRSFVGYFPMPVRHGMTVGELAKMFNAENHIGADLEVIENTGWRRNEWFDATGLPWVNPSPNMRSLNAATLYPAVALPEYSPNLSVGRGTDRPFEHIGAEFIDGMLLADALNAQSIPGVRAYSESFQPDAGAKLGGKKLGGVAFVITNRDVFDAGRLGVALLAALQKLYPGKFPMQVNQTLIGSPALIQHLGEGQSPKELLAAEQSALDRFLRIRQNYLIYH